MQRRPIILSGLALAIAGGSLVAEDDSQQVEFFENKIRPVLAEHCYKCHSAEAEANGKLKGGLYLDDREGSRRGGDTGAAVVPKNEKKSLLLAALRYEDDLEMPPKNQLPPEVVADFAKWIRMGAPDPRDGQEIVREGIDLEKGSEFWSFQPLAGRDKAVTVDGLISDKLDEIGLKPVTAAEPEKLVRRVYFDLIGLPPSPKDLESWASRLGSKSENALGELIDSLLASPQFGERWGRHWLDVARYGESNGNTRNATFPHAWRYRDYVIDAFNTDTPYDEFIQQQIAGDLLPHDDVEERNRNLVATGFLALASKPVIRNKSKSGFVPDIADDQINVISKGVLGLTVACARCHDHKFDPIPTTDYYGLAGLFASSETLYGGGGKNMGGAPATPLHLLADKDPTKLRAYEAWKAENKRLAAEQGKLNNRLKKLRPKRVKGKPAPKPTVEAKARIAEIEKERQKLAVEIKKLRANAPEPPSSAMGVRDRGNVREVPVYVRGESPKGEPISRRFVSVISGGESPTLPDSQSGRLEFAQWITSKDNPLTARVFVNRVWGHLFGTGIVRTSDNFGQNGERPSNPQLLDYVAADFAADGWSIKRLIKRLMLTDAYQRSDAHDPKNYQIDPDNTYLWRHSRKRLEAEAIRDSILTVSGNLALTRPKGSVVTAHGGKLIQDALTPDKIHRPSNHRSVYLAMLRNGLPESLEVFDVANPSLVVGNRSVTTVPSQDLFLINSPFVVENSKAFASRILTHTNKETDPIVAAYRIALSRDPTANEKKRAAEFISETANSLADHSEDSETAAWATFCQALLISAEFRHLH